MHFVEDFDFISDPNLFETQISNPDGVNNILFLIEPGSVVLSHLRLELTTPLVLCFTTKGVGALR